MENRREYSGGSAEQIGRPFDAIVSPPLRVNKKSGSSILFRTRPYRNSLFYQRDTATVVPE